MVPSPAAAPERPRRAGLLSRGSVEVTLGAALLALSLLLTLRAAGGWFSDAIVWPVVLVVAGTALLWRRSTASPELPEAERPRVQPPPEVTAKRESDQVRERAAVASRTGVGIALVLTAGLAFLQSTGALSAARDVVVGVLVVLAVLAIIFAPWVVRLVRSLTAERSERIRSQERAELAAHLHDSVLQTLAMVQRRSHDPREVAALARSQERELRDWLSGRSEEAAGSLARSLEDTAADVEQSHGVPVEVVTVGDRDLDPATEAMVAAAREAMVNAAKFGGGHPVDVYAETGPRGTEVFVRDRGPGFDPEAIPSDRRGVRESILGRMERHGGHARIASSPENGTEVELTLEGRP